MVSRSTGSTRTCSRRACTLRAGHRSPSCRACRPSSGTDRTARRRGEMPDTIKVAVSGPIKSGKTTIRDLIVQFLRYNGFEVEVEDIDGVRELTALDNLRERA